MVSASVDLLKQLLLIVSFVATSAASCSYDGTTYNVGSTDIKKSDCESCQCLARTLYSDSTTGLTCRTIQCPVPDCPNPIVPSSGSGQCCPRCRDVCERGIEITNCPSSPVRISLPSNRDDVLYRFVPTTRDCEDQGRAITTSKSPPSNIYQWIDGEAGHEVTVTASAQGTADTSCTFTVIPVGKSLFFLYVIFSMHAACMYSICRCRLSVCYESIAMHSRSDLFLNKGQ